MARSLASIKKIKKSDLLKHILPSELSNKELASVLSALNTNSHELEDIGGSGLFLLGCLMEHSCRPSCNFVTDGTLLTVIATEGETNTFFASLSRNNCSSQISQSGCPYRLTMATSSIALLQRDKRSCSKPMSFSAHVLNAQPSSIDVEPFSVTSANARGQFVQKEVVRTCQIGSALHVREA